MYVGVYVFLDSYNQFFENLNDDSSHIGNVFISNKILRTYTKEITVRIETSSVTSQLQ